MFQTLINKRIFHSALLFGLSLSFMVPVNSVASEELNVYSARKTHLIKPLLEQFAADTGITVRLLSSKADALLKKLETEGTHSPADVLITTDAGRLHRAKQSGVLQPMQLEKITQADKTFVEEDNTWLSLTKRARVIVYAKDRVQPEELSSYEDLADPKWRKRICIRSSNNIYNQSLVASMIAHNGEEKTAKWANEFVENFARKPKGGDRDQVKAVAAGQCDLAIVNTYYLAQMLKSKDQDQVSAAQKTAVFWPNQQDRGAHVNVSGIAITKSSKNVDNAHKLINFLLSESAQKWYAEQNNEYPVLKTVEVSSTLENWGEFKGDQINLQKLGELNSNAVKIMDRAGWR